MGAILPKRLFLIKNISTIEMLTVKSGFTKTNKKKCIVAISIYPHTPLFILE